jgi:methyl-accepting chemotaxis protein
MSEALQIMRSETGARLAEIEKAAAELVAPQRSSLKLDQSNAESAKMQSNVLNVVLTLLLAVAGVGGFVALQRTSRDIRQIVETLRHGAAGMVPASNQLSSSSRTLAGLAAGQAASIQETSASSEEIRAMADRNGANAEAAAEDMERAAELIRASSSSLEQMGKWTHGLRE